MQSSMWHRKSFPVNGRLSEYCVSIMLFRKQTEQRSRRTSSRLDDRIPLSMKGKTILDSPHVKILGVVMDQRLKYDIHAARVAKRGLRAVIVLKRLRGLRRSTSCQLFSLVENTNGRLRIAGVVARCYCNARENG